MRVSQQVDPRALRGLSAGEAARRLREDGYNELPASRGRSAWAIAAEVAREPMFLLLVACATLYFALGDVGEAAMLSGFVAIVMGITIYQERKTERALEALRELSSPRALVIRGGEQVRIPGREVVRGDLLVVGEGDRVPADAVLLWGLNLAADESLLTGESAAVRKRPGDRATPVARPGGDDLPFLYSGTLVVQGQGIAEVVETGRRTEMGKIGVALQTVDVEQTTLQRDTDRIVRRIALLGAALCAVVVVGYGVTRGDWLQGILAGITLAMALLPEEFPVVLTVFLALGAWRMSRRRVLTRRIPAVETLGAATVLCVDKTGTLTMNQMSVGRLFARGGYCEVDPHAPGALPESCHELVEFGILASKKDPFDPMEKALRRLGDRSLAETEHLHDDWTLVQEYPLSPGLLALSHVWQSGDRVEYVVAAKGAPEAIADLCHVGAEEARELEARLSEMAGDGLRVLGVARARCRAGSLPEEQHDLSFDFLGLIGLRDPVRPAVPGAVRECYDAGIRVVVITGDYPGTARRAAREIGLESPDECITGPELDTMDDAELERRVGDVNLFARVVPEQKLRIVNALKARGHVVAMTGDGVNDAPALKAAHIGVAMGGRGTDVAREAAALVLLDDDFSSIVGAVRMGRRIFDNLRKAMAYIVAVHVPIAGMSLVPVLLGWPLIFLPVHIVFLELIIDPACSVVFEGEGEEADVMTRPPRDPTMPIFDRRTLGLSLLQGVSVFLVVLAVYGVALGRGQGESDARALAFTTLIIANLGLILSNRSWSRTGLGMLRSPNRSLWWVLGGACVFLAAVLWVPGLRDAFHLSTLHALDLGLCLAAGAVSVLWFEVLKLLRSPRAAVSGPS